MGAVAGVVAAFGVGAVLRYKKWHWLLAWAASCTMVPAFVLFVEFVLPSDGEGASMWPVAMLFGGIYGAIFGAAGVLLGWRLRKSSSQ